MTILIPTGLLVTYFNTDNHVDAVGEEGTLKSTCLETLFISFGPIVKSPLLYSSQSHLSFPLRK